MGKRLVEHAAIAMNNGKYRMISVSWEENARGDNYDYYHAAFEQNGRWNAEFYDQNDQMIWVHGTEDNCEFAWQHETKQHAERGWPETGDPTIRIEVRDVDFEDVPKGSLCQTVEERGDGIPRHWKKWRIV